MHYLQSLGFDEARVHALLVAVDRYDKQGDAAFKGYAEQFGPLEPAAKEKVLAFLQIKGLDQLAAVARSRRAIRRWPRAWPTGAGSSTAWRRWGSARFVAVDLGVVRGLAYYTGFVFEAFDRKGDLRALAGGGRYNDLVKKLGGPDLPAVGFAIGDMTFELLLEQRGLMPGFV